MTNTLLASNQIVQIVLLEIQPRGVDKNKATIDLYIMILEILNINSICIQCVNMDTVLTIECFLFFFRPSRWGGFHPGVYKCWYNQYNALRSWPCIIYVFSIHPEQIGTIFKSIGCLSTFFDYSP